jgi:hypothetical protein
MSSFAQTYSGCVYTLGFESLRGRIKCPLAFFSFFCFFFLGGSSCCGIQSRSLYLLESEFPLFDGTCHLRLVRSSTCLRQPCLTMWTRLAKVPTTSCRHSCQSPPPVRPRTRLRSLGCFLVPPFCSLAHRSSRPVLSTAKYVVSCRGVPPSYAVVEHADGCLVVGDDLDMLDPRRRPDV